MRDRPLPTACRKPVIIEAAEIGHKKALVSLLLRGKLWKNYTNESKTNDGVVLEEATFEGYCRCVQPQTSKLTQLRAVPHPHLKLNCANYLSNRP